MAFIISIETATPVCSVALHKNGELVALRGDNDQRKHAENITLFINEVVNEAGITLQDISAIVVSKGPGSYTGLRIGVSAAKGLCYGLNIPLLSVNTLESMAHNLALAPYINTNTLFCPMLDARRMEVYCALFDSDKNCIKETEAVIVDALSFAQQLQHHRIVFFGSGAAKCKSTITHPNALFVEGIEASANFLGKMGYQKFTQQLFEDVAYFEPFYLKEFVATVSKK